MVKAKPVTAPGADRLSIAIASPIPGKAIGTQTANVISVSPTPIIAKEKPADPQVIEPRPSTVVQPTEVSQPSSGCEVVLFGERYDLQAFRQVHPGGDIFQCNTDMSAVFSSQHPMDYLAKLAPYKIN
jgi:hypothetical protein